MEASGDLAWPLTLEGVQALGCKLERGEQVSSSDAKRLLLELKGVLLNVPNVQKVVCPPEGRVTVVGDTHGQLVDLLFILSQQGLPSHEHRSFLSSPHEAWVLHGLMWFWPLPLPGQVFVQR